MAERLALPTSALVLDKKVVILHVGTNNIEKMETGAILSAFNNLISSIRQKSDPMIVISSIMVIGSKM